MAFDKPTRNRLAAFVSNARTLIAEEFTEQFQGLYGISGRGTTTPLDQLGHLDDAGIAVATLLRDRIEYLARTHPEDKTAAEAAVARLAREQAFTILNRLAAIRMAEKRGFIVESVGRGYQSKGFKVFEQVAGSGLGDTYQRYRRYLYCLFDELALDLGLLFDRHSPQGLLFPCEPALQELLALLNSPDIDTLWAEDETIGWIYQYYNDPVERKKMRESPAPRNSRELAVRNQFFTPRYVVEFLTDNTLGRIWYEMTQGQTRLKDQCLYLVRRPKELFLRPGESAPELLQQDNLNREQLLQQPVHTPHRQLRDPREIRMLDPACGSMHFGLYAFDLFEIIYDEAWEIAHSSGEGREPIASFVPFVSLVAQYLDKSAFLADVPRLIIEHNLHGVDIDPRCVQIAGLSLWLRAQRAWQHQALHPQNRPLIRRSNIVCAEPMPGDEAFLDEFIEAHLATTPEHKLLGQLVRRMFGAMQLAGEAGTLLKIEEEIAGAVAEAKQKWRAIPKYEQGRLFADGTALSAEKEPGLDVTGITDETFWEQAEERIYAALGAYAKQVEHGGGYLHRLFAEDTARGFAFIDVCRKRYDVVLMNPPYGEASEGSSKYLDSAYREGGHDIYAVFLEMAVGRGSARSLIGALTSRTFLFNERFISLRREVLTHSLQVLLDLGLGVLDAAVDVAAFVYSPSRACQDQLVCIDVLSVEDKSARLMDSLNDLRRGRLGATAYFPTREGLRALPESVLCYSVSPSLEHVFKKYDSLYPGKASVLKGLITGDDFCFLRANWEVDPALIGAARAWEWFHKGGGYSPYYSDVHLLVAWNSDGARLKADAAKKYGSATRTIKNEAFFRKPGLGYGVVNSIGFSVKVIPKGTLFGDVGPVIQPSADSDIEFLLGFLNSELVRVLLRVRQVGERGRFAWTSNLIEQIPVPSTDNTPVKESAREITNLFQELCLTDEISPLFRGLPFVGESLESGPKNILAVSNFTLEERAARVAALESQIDLAIYESIGVCRDELTTFTARLTNSERPTSCFLAFATAHTNEFSQRFISWLLGCTFGRWDIRYATREKVAPELPDPLASLPICPPGQLQNAQGLPVSPEAVPAAYPVLIPWDGILVDDPGHPLDVETRVQQVLQVIWKERWETVEHEVCELLGVPSLRAYFCKPAGFFADHLKRYSKSRRQAPIYWPLSTAKGSYTLWIYYHRLTEQTLHTALADFVDPKLKAVRAEAFSFRESATNHTRLEKLLDLEKELEEYRAEIERIIKLPWKPNLNDGALITASPLWKLFRLPKWQKDLKACWDNLARGEHDWAHLAYSIWPKRVEDACKTDRSIAIAHDLEHLCQVEPPKAKRGKKRTTDAPEELGL